MRVKPGIVAFYLLLLAATPGKTQRNNPTFPAVDLRPTLRPSALVDARSGVATIAGRVRPGVQEGGVWVRVTTSQGETFQTRVPLQANQFQCAYPRDFPHAPRLSPGVLFVDAAPAGDSEANRNTNQAEATLLVYDSRSGHLPDFPSAFTTNLRDQRGRQDASSREWPAMRALTNLYFHSRGARLAGVGKPNFDLAQPADFTYYKNSLALYDFENRDRDWTQPLGQRPARTFWNAAWRTWFNASNDNPVDGNPRNPASSDYVPYAFTNDFADLLIWHERRRRTAATVEDDLDLQCREAVQNLIACQHRDPTNFALPDAKGRRETYTAGAFRYGLFANGDFLTEGKGWFYNPASQDYAHGGVLNGRAVWALGEALKAEPHGPQANALKTAIARAAQYCLRDALTTGYAKRTPQGHAYWRDAGEHAYLTLGLLAAASVAPDLAVFEANSKQPIKLEAVCVEALQALCDLERPTAQWAIYPNVDSMAIAALTEGALLFRKHPEAAKWQTGAERAADAWMTAQIDPKEYSGPPVHFGLRLTPTTMTYNWGRIAPDSWKSHNVLFFYQTGHWIHALARLYALTGKTAYRLRTEAMIGYLCGDNPWGIRLLTETGGVYNWVEDKDGDGIEEALRLDIYPESTAYCHIGILHLLHSLAQTRSIMRKEEQQ